MYKAPANSPAAIKVGASIPSSPLSSETVHNLSSLGGAVEAVGDKTEDEAVLEMPQFMNTLMIVLNSRTLF